MEHDSCFCSVTLLYQVMMSDCIGSREVVMAGLEMALLKVIKSMG